MSLLNPLAAVQWSPLHNLQMVHVVSISAWDVYESCLVRTEYTTYKYLYVSPYANPPEVFVHIVNSKADFLMSFSIVELLNDKTCYILGTMMVSTTEYIT